MPLYYLILAEAMGSEAYWSFSPLHSFVKIQDGKGAWYNIELTFTLQNEKKVLFFSKEKRK